MLNLRQSCGRPIFNMRIPIPGKEGLYIETGPWSGDLKWIITQSADITPHWARHLERNVTVLFGQLWMFSSQFLSMPMFWNRVCCRHHTWRDFDVFPLFLEEAVEQTVQSPLIWGTIRLMWCCSNGAISFSPCTPCTCLSYCCFMAGWSSLVKHWKIIGSYRYLLFESLLALWKIFLSMPHNAMILLAHCTYLMPLCINTSSESSHWFRQLPIWFLIITWTIADLVLYWIVGLV